jgi:hypothetical protein
MVASDTGYVRAALSAAKPESDMPRFAQAMLMRSSRHSPPRHSNASTWRD